jgi:hypothetical protein
MARPLIVTANGNAQIDTAQSQFGGSSGVFAATNDYLSIANSSDIAFGTGNFTIECWFRATARSTQYPLIVANGPNWTTNRFQLNDRHDSANTKLTFWVNNANSGSPLLTSSTSISNGVWYHVAIVRNGSNWKMYVNGVEESSNTSSASLDGGVYNTYYVGGRAVASEYFNGHIDEFRISNSARYTANFTPATTAFQNDANTLLLLHMDGTDASTKFIDDIRPQTFTVAGNAQITGTQSKFGGQSLVFDGNQDYMTTPYSAPYWKWNDNDYTIEFWANFNAIPSGNNPIQIGLMDPTGGLNYWSFGIISGGAPTIYYYNGSENRLSGSTSISQLNVWHHLAFVYTKSNNTIRLFLNGTQGASATVSGTPQFQDVGATVITIGQYNNNGMNGYLDEIRVSKSARYTSNFTPATSAFTTDANTLLLIHGDPASGGNTLIVDDVPQAAAIEEGAATDRKSVV